MVQKNMLSLNNKRVMVTGGAGFIGSHLVDRIIHDMPEKLVVVDNFFLGSEDNLSEAFKVFPDLRLHRLDASDLSSMQQVVKDEKIDVVFNLAVIPLPTSLRYPVWTIHTNIGIATTFCELARQGHIQTLVHCSSSEAYGTAKGDDVMNENHPLDPVTPYAASKAAEDHVVLSYSQTFGINTVVVRPFNNFGPRQNAGAYAGIIPIVVDRVKNDLPIEIFGDGLQTRDYIFVRDTANAIIGVYESVSTRGRVINIASGQEISVNDLVRRLLKVMGTPNYPIIHISPRPGDVRRHCGGVESLKKLTGFEPKAITDENLRETVQWYMEKSQ
jgi:UDP-glucose 4-epimerase